MSISLIGMHNFRQIQDISMVAMGCIGLELFMPMGNRW